MDDATEVMQEIAPPAGPARRPYPYPEAAKVRFRSEIAAASETYDQLGPRVGQR